ncbi:hypothetical protein CR513_28026, partial [Mucuna pruriens]
MAASPTDSNLHTYLTRMASGACQMMLRCVFEGSISLHDMEIERRPYHKNCGCELHNLNVICYLTLSVTITTHNLKVHVA